MNSNGYSNAVYKDFNKLEQRFLAIRQRISLEEVKVIDEKMGVLRKEISEFEGDWDFSGKYQMAKKLADLEMNHLSEARVKEILRLGIIEVIVNQLNVLEGFIGNNHEQVLEQLKLIESSWDSIKSSCSEVDKAEIDNKLLNLLIKSYIEKIKTTGELDVEVINSFCNSTGYYILTKMLMEKSQNIDGMDKVLVGSWLNKSIDGTTGLINEAEMKKILHSSDFWRVISGNYELKDVMPKEPELNTREAKINKLSQIYGIPVKKLKCKKDGIILILEAYEDNKYLMKKMSYKNFLERKKSSNFSERAVAVIIGNGIDDIKRESFFAFKQLKFVIFPEELGKIRDHAFAYSAVENVEMPDSVVYLGDHAFTQCEELKKVKLSNGLKSIGVHVFSNCIIEEIEIPDSVETIDSSAFYYCKRLRNVKLPNNLKSIGNSAFENTALKEIEIPDSVQTMENYVFYQCRYLNSVKLPSNIKTVPCGLFKESGLKEIEIPNSVENIEESAFCKCYDLKKVVLSNRIKKLGALAFENSGIEEIEIPEGVEVIEENTFSNCYNLKNVILPKGLKAIKRGAFRRSALQRIEIPEHLLIIEYEAFSECKKLNEAILPSSVGGVHISAFKGSKIEEMEMPNGVGVLGEHSLVSYEIMNL